MTLDVRAAKLKIVGKVFTEFDGNFDEPTTLLKKRLWHRSFPVNFAKFLRAPFFTEHLWATVSEAGLK